MGWTKYVRSIKVSEMLKLFAKKLWVMILAAMVAIAVVHVIYSTIIPPEYESTATLYILKQGKESDSYETSQDFSLALDVVNDCTYLLKSHAVVDKVIDDLGLDVSYKNLSDSISTKNPDNTRILEVTVTSDTSEHAKEIVDAVCNVGANKISKAMGFKQVNIYEYGTKSRVPSNHHGKADYLLVGIIAAILVYSIFLIRYILDDKIRSNDDVSRYLGLSVLGEIPDATENHKHHYGYYKGKYGYGNRYGYGKTYGYGEQRNGNK